MAIDASYLALLHEVVKLAKSDDTLQALCLAYPDLLVNEAVLNQVLGDHILKNVSQRGDAHKIWKWHGLKQCQEPIYDTTDVFNRLGIELTIIDIVQARGDERIVDLNEPLPEDLKSKFDLVIDTGTCEHCFNVAQAFRNSCEALKQGGHLVHAAPISKCNHGFWNFCPTVYPDFLNDNGFEIIYMFGVTGNLVSGLKPFDIEPFARAKLPPEAAIYVAAQRVEICDFRWPVQRKYR